MKPEELQQLITNCLQGFAQRRLKRLETLKLRNVLRRKNPYLYKAVGTQSATEIVENILSAYLSSSDEGMFGDEFFEPVAKAVSGGHVSDSEGVDIAVETPNRYLAISVKSGPYPYNSSQKRKQNEQFLALKSRLTKLKKQFDAMLAHCYGRTNARPTEKRIYRIASGQKFWEELTGDPHFYLKLIRMMKEEIIEKHRQDYRTAWQLAVNRYVREFTNDFCDQQGAIDWEKLVYFNSGLDDPKKRVKPKQGRSPSPRGRRTRTSET